MVLTGDRPRLALPSHTDTHTPKQVCQQAAGEYKSQNPGFGSERAGGATAQLWARGTARTGTEQMSQTRLSRQPGRRIAVRVPPALTTIVRRALARRPSAAAWRRSHRSCAAVRRHTRTRPPRTPRSRCPARAPRSPPSTGPRCPRAPVEGGGRRRWARSSAAAADPPAHPAARASFGSHPSQRSASSSAASPMRPSRRPAPGRGGAAAEDGSRVAPSLRGGEGPGAAELKARAGRDLARRGLLFPEACMARKALRQARELRCEEKLVVPLRRVQQCGAARRSPVAVGSQHAVKGVDPDAASHVESCGRVSQYKAAADPQRDAVPRPRVASAPGRRRVRRRLDRKAQPRQLRRERGDGVAADLSRARAMSGWGGPRVWPSRVAPGR